MLTSSCHRFSDHCARACTASILLLVSLCAAAQPQQSSTGEVVYVSNEDSNDLSVISTRDNTLIDTIAVGTRPRGVKVSPDGRTVFVALSGSPKCPPTMPDEECEKLVADKSLDGIAEIDATTRKVKRILPGGSDPEQFDVSWTAKKLFVSNEDANQATIVDLATGAVERTITVGREPEGVRLSPDGKICYVTGETDHNVTVIDTATGNIIGQIEVGLRPRDAVFSLERHSRIRVVGAGRHGRPSSTSRPGPCSSTIEVPRGREADGARGVTRTTAAYTCRPDAARR
jgi:YVTN family beta-propeller protein